MWKAKFFIDAKLPRRHPDGYDFITMELEREIPFIPMKGMLLSVVVDGDLFKVDEVHWSVQASDSLVVFFEDDHLGIPFKAKYLAEQDWTEQVL